jgi:ribonuclease Y
VNEQILINVTPQETRVAVTEQGAVQELHVERSSSRGLVGNIYLGRVCRVLPGMQSAFVEIGLTRAAFLHDVGKAIDRDLQGTHLELGLDFLRKHGESEPVLMAVAAHHMDIDWPSLEAMLVQAADAISAARPGARRDILESYVKRLEKLESIADSFEGVSKAFALQAGREIRIVVESDRVSDEATVWLSKDIAKRIENELEYPGQIKVTVIRETRAVEYAR